MCKKILAAALALVIAVCASACGDPEQDELCTYEEYLAMSAEDQMAYFKSFENIEDYFEWYNAAKAKYEAENPSVDIGDGGIDLDDYKTN